MKGILTIIVLFMATFVYAQDEPQEEFQTLFGSDYNSGGYGALEFRFGQVNNNMSLLLGGRGGWVIGNKFVIGGGGYGMTTNNILGNNQLIAGVDSTDLKLGLGYGGIMLEYIAMPHKAIHFSFPLILGAGGASVSKKIYDPNNTINSEDWTNYEIVESSGFFVVEPGVNVDLNLIKFMRISFGAKYSVITGTNLER
jgi:hypothetical protein